MEAGSVLRMSSLTQKAHELPKGPTSCDPQIVFIEQIVVCHSEPPGPYTFGGHCVIL